MLLLGSRFRNRLNTEGCGEFDRGCLRKSVRDEFCRVVQGDREKLLLPTHFQDWSWFGWYGDLDLLSLYLSFLLLE